MHKLEIIDQNVDLDDLQLFMCEHSEFILTQKNVHNDLSTCVISLHTPNIVCKVLKFRLYKKEDAIAFEKWKQQRLQAEENKRIAKEMGELFRGRDIRKYYWAVTSPSPKLPQGKIQSSLAKVEGPGGERMMAVNDDEGKNALTFYSVMETVGHQMAWVAFWPRTGRTHQIRVHAAQMGCPLLGDYKYGFDQSFLEEIPELPRVLHLHARRIIFRHPVTEKKIDISAPLGVEMKKTFKYFGFNPDDKSDPFEDID